MDSEKLQRQWAQVTAQVKSYSDVDASQVDAFFSRLEPQAMSDSFLMLTADNDFIKTWVEQHYTDTVKRALYDLTGVPFTVAIAVDPSQEARKAAARSGAAPAPTAPMATPSAPMPATTPALAPAPPATPAALSPSTSPAAASPSFPAPWGNEAPSTPAASPMREAYQRDEFEDHYTPQPAPAVEPQGHYGNEYDPLSTLTFANFVIGDSNRLAYSMAVEVAEDPGRAHLNPLFIYGKSGLGKTHLMCAIKNYIEETRPDMRAVYVDTSEFVNKFMEASVAHDREKESFKNFQQQYEQADILLIDDIQYLQGKKQTLDIIFHLFNSLSGQGKQIVLAADRAPQSISIDERYRSRFAGGYPIAIDPPDIETKLGIVRSFANEFSKSEGLDRFSLPDDIQMYIAENSGSNIRELKSAVTKVIYQMVILDDPNMTVEEARMTLANHFTGGMSSNLTVGDIQHVVEGYYKVSHNDLVGPKRDRAVVYPRKVAMYLCRKMLDIPYGEISKKFNRDHSTAIHAVSSVEEMLKDMRQVQEDVEVLLEEIKNL